MQEFRIKSVGVAKKGTNAKGEWTLVKLVVEYRDNLV